MLTAKAIYAIVFLQEFIMALDVLKIVCPSIALLVALFNLVMDIRIRKDRFLMILKDINIIFLALALVIINLPKS
jgi:hypothetical protein